MAEIGLAETFHMAFWNLSKFIFFYKEVLFLRILFYLNQNERNDVQNDFFKKILSST